ncbi:hypothetical protein Poli38472_004678 [Pythium oligandrum]|uniref:Uncharacterized protein n=1 Tax=Pythium oligandrum TaxID=41045 RepID=A0A8K1FG43_PYTOL|nr:hypothetical protein Poli38472_004678 [Pythium oligandrum]|eukprot:TMW59609.1 hypothetical protein Poli38472_004678 [Pythium oligandrum]
MTHHRRRRHRHRHSDNTDRPDEERSESQYITPHTVEEEAEEVNVDVDVDVDVEEDGEEEEEEEEEVSSYGFFPVQTAAELVRMLEAINTNMEFEVATIQNDYEEYVTQRGTEIASMDRILLRFELKVDEQYTTVARTITEAMGYTIEGMGDALVRFELRSLAGSGEKSALTMDEIERIKDCVEKLVHLRQQVTGSTTPTAIKESRISFFNAAQVQAATAVWAFTTGPPDMMKTIDAHLKVELAQTKCNILHRAGFTVPTDLLEAADEEAYENGILISDAFDAKRNEELDQRGFDELEIEIAFALFLDLPEFTDATVAAMRILLGETDEDDDY